MYLGEKTQEEYPVTEQGGDPPPVFYQLVPASREPAGFFLPHCLSYVGPLDVRLVGHERVIGSGSQGSLSRILDDMRIHRLDIALGANAYVITIKGGPESRTVTYRPAVIDPDSINNAFSQKT